ncbi:hypothetical protein Fcan01_17582 [Folsomia candida]|uniref:Secreted protein n=1 Tax=Folsomia candida TaxID=158441 RepID=A0A226DS46_FOLCA|nr:hypothetical protein Fcan01_17582 [Folsomia candida]
MRPNNIGITLLLIILELIATLCHSSGAGLTATMRRPKHSGGYETQFQPEFEDIDATRHGRSLMSDKKIVTNRVAAGNGSGTRYPHTRTILAGTRYLRVARTTRTATSVDSECVFSEVTEAYASLKCFSLPENAEKSNFLNIICLLSNIGLTCICVRE